MADRNKSQNKEKKDRKGRTHLKLFTLALILAVFIFLFGVLLGNYIAAQQLNLFKETEEKFLVYLMALDMRDDILGEENICNTEISDIFAEKTKLGQMLTELERRLGKENQEVMKKKEIYELIEIKTLTTIKNIKERCDKKPDIILFFYTNKKDDSKGNYYGSDDQGKILDQVVHETEDERGRETIFVFPFDINSENLATRAMMVKYNITEAPSLIINENKYSYSVKEEIKLITQQV